MAPSSHPKGSERPCAPKADRFSGVPVNLRDDDPAMFSGHKALHLARARFRTAQIRFRFGEANLRRGGEYVTVIAVGRMVVFAEKD